MVNKVYSNAQYKQAYRVTKVVGLNAWCYKVDFITHRKVADRQYRFRINGNSLRTKFYDLYITHERRTVSCQALQSL